MLVRLVEPMRKNDHLIEPFLEGLPGSKGKPPRSRWSWALIGFVAILALIGILTALGT